MTSPEHALYVLLVFCGIKHGWLRSDANDAGVLPDYFLKYPMSKGNNPARACHTAHVSNLDGIGFYPGLMCAIYGAIYLFSLTFFIFKPCAYRSVFRHL